MTTLWRSLLWKEWREVRVFVPVGAGLLLVIHLMAVLLGRLEPGTFDSELGGVLALMVVLPLVAMLVGATLLAGETQSGTARFLVSLPVAPGRLWWPKAMVGASVVVLIVLAATALALLFGSLGDAPLGGSGDFAEMMGGAFRVALFAFLAALLGSALSRHPMAAVGVGLVVGGAVGVSAFLAATWISNNPARAVNSWWWLAALSAGILPALPSHLAFCRLSAGAGRGLWRGLLALVGGLFLTLTVSAVAASLRVVPGHHIGQGHFPILSVAPSPDGSRVIVSVGGRREPNRAGTRGYVRWGPLWLIDAASGGGRVFDLGASPAWSPDGRFVAYLSDRGASGLRRLDCQQRVWTYEPATDRQCPAVVTGPQRDYEATAPLLWSPDSCAVLFSRSILGRRPGWRAVWRRGLDRRPGWSRGWTWEGQDACLAFPGDDQPLSTAPLLATDAGEVRVHGWADDSQRAFVSAGSTVYAASVTQPHRWILSSEYDPMFRRRVSAAGGRTVLPDGSVTDASCARLARIPVVPGWISTENTLSPNGRYVACTYRQVEEIRVSAAGSRSIRYKPGNRLAVVDLETRLSVDIGDQSTPSGAAWMLEPAWSPDSQKLAVYRSVSGHSPTIQIQVYTANSARLIDTVTIPPDEGESFMSWFSWLDSDQLLLVHDQGGIWLTEVGGEGPRKLFPDDREAQR